MQKVSYICYDGEFIRNDAPLIETSNRAFRYGDALFETMHGYATAVQFLDNHLRRLTNSMKVLKMEIPGYFNEDYFKNRVEGLLNKNRTFKGVRLRLTVFRKGGGLYTPESNEVSYLLESEPLEEEKYVLNRRGLIIDVYPDLQKPINILSNLKTTNSLFFILAGLYRKENELDDCIILNENGRITESQSSNIFIVKGFKAYTPGLKEGCLAGTMRLTVIQILNNSGYAVNADCSLTQGDLEDADEIFLTNAISGVRWVVAFRQRRYFNKTSRLLINQLNKLAFND